MAAIKKLVLDVLKPHRPNIVEFAQRLADRGDRVKVIVVEMDDKTETLVVEVEGTNIDFDSLAESISDFGGSLHSIDEVEVAGDETRPS